MRLALLQRLGLCGACLWAGLSLPGYARPWTQQKLLAEFSQLQPQGNCVACTLEKQRVLILFDQENTAAALVADCSVGAVRKLEKLLELGDTVEDETPTCIVVLRADITAPAKKRLPENNPLHALSYLLRQGYYHPTELQADGRVLWATGKRRSLDLLVPATGEKEPGALEIKAGMTMDTFAANVLARKLGYPADSTSDATKAEQAAKMRADGVFYFLSARDVAVATKGNRAYIGTCGKEGIPGLMAYKARAVDFPAITLKEAAPPAGSPPTPNAALPPKTAAPAAPAPAQPAELPPAQALKDYLRRLRKL